MSAAVLKRPSALLPIAMSMTALAIVIVYAVRFGTARQADEGTAAHLWQLLMAGQLPVIGFFALKWLPADPRSTVMVLVLQFLAGVAALFPVWYFQW